MPYKPTSLSKAARYSLASQKPRFSLSACAWSSEVTVTSVSLPSCVCRIVKQTNVSLAVFSIQIIVPLSLLYSYMQLIITSCIVKPRSWPGSAYVPLTKPARHTCCMLPLPTTQQQQAGLQSWTTIPNSPPQGTLAKYSEFEPRACDVS